jgi:hypothetical protein
MCMVELPGIILVTGTRAVITIFIRHHRMLLVAGSSCGESGGKILLPDLFALMQDAPLAGGADHPLMVPFNLAMMLRFENYPGCGSGAASPKTTKDERAEAPEVDWKLDKPQQPPEPQAHGLRAGARN